MGHEISAVRQLAMFFLLRGNGVWTHGPWDGLRPQAAAASRSLTTAGSARIVDGPGNLAAGICQVEGCSIPVRRHHQGRR